MSPTSLQQVAVMEWETVLAEYNFQSNNTTRQTQLVMDLLRSCCGLATGKLVQWTLALKRHKTVGIGWSTVSAVADLNGSQVQRETGRSILYAAADRAELGWTTTPVNDVTTPQRLYRAI